MCLIPNRDLPGGLKTSVVEKGALPAADRSERVYRLHHGGLRVSAWYPWLLVRMESFLVALEEYFFDNAANARL